MKSFLKKVYMSETEGPRRRDRSVLKYKDRIKEYMHETVAEKGRIRLARRECMDKVRLRLFCCDYFLGDRERGETR